MAKTIELTKLTDTSDVLRELIEEKELYPTINGKMLANILKKFIKLVRDDWPTIFKGSRLSSEDVDCDECFYVFDKKELHLEVTVPTVGAGFWFYYIYKNDNWDIADIEHASPSENDLNLTKLFNELS